MTNAFPNDDFDARAVETEPMEAGDTAPEFAAVDDTLGSGGAITNPLLVGASGPDGAGTGLGGPMDGAVDGASAGAVDGASAGASDGPSGGGEDGSGDGFTGEDLASEDVQSSLRSTAPDRERSAAADSPDATIPTAAGDEVSPGSRDEDGD